MAKKKEGNSSFNDSFNFSDIPYNEYNDNNQKINIYI